MAAQQLNVRVGLLFDEKSLANIERQMRSSGQRLSKIGTDLSLSLSLPLAAFGATAIKSAGDIESLTLALKSQLGTADAAAKELEALTEAAKNPGLGVEQAVRGSVRLQGVGFAAEEARQVLIQMGNAIAATGGSAEELDAVTRQFAQMTSKGRVLQEDVSVLSENMPGLAQLMQKAFGTQSVEAIRDMGITGKEFVKQITKAAEELPRVEGGIKNGIGNAIDSLKQSAAKVGLAINQAFNVTGAIESVSSAVLALAQGFSALPDPIQKVILGFAALAIATGPVVSAYGAIQLMGSRLVAGWGLVVGAIKPVIAAFNALSLATRAFILVGVVVAVLSFIDAFSQYQSQLSDTEKAQASLLNIQKQAADSIQGQKSEVDTLVAAYQAEGATLKQKEQILGRLNQISPEYFGKLRVGKGDVEALTIATAAYGKQLLVVAELSSLNKRLEQIATDLRNVEDAAEPSALESIGNAVLSAGNSFLFAANQSKTFAENSKEITAALTEEQAALQKRATELALGAAATDNLSDKYKNLGGASDETKEKLKTLKEVLEDVKNASIKASLIGDDADQAKIEALQKGIVRLIDAGFKPASAEVLNLKTQLDRLNEKPTDVVINIIKKEGGGGVADLAGGGPIPQAAPNLQPVDVVPAITAATVALEKHQKAQKEVAEWQEKLNLGQIDFTESLGPLISSLAASGDIMKASFVAMGDAIAQSAASGETSLQKLGQAAVGAAAKIVRAYIQQGVAAAVAKALSGLPFPLNLAAGAAAGGLAAALFTKAIGSIGVKGFAKGTNFAPGGVALVGEQGPELINLPRGSQVFPTPQTNKMLSGMGGNSMSLDGEFTVRGTDLVLVLDRANRKNDRLR